jgi:hypothetical protein
MNQNIMMLLYRMVQQHAELLKVVADQTTTVTAKLDAITERINAMPCKPGDSKASEVFIPSEESTSSNKLLDIICKGRSMFTNLNSHRNFLPLLIRNVHSLCQL